MIRADDLQGAESTPASAGFDCPRCGTATIASFYGPCDDCCQQLRTTYARGARDIEAEAYEPKMNVTANAVALKDD